jgi:hypothetical protein
MNLHLRILYGPDNRAEIVKQTIRVCRPHFCTIRLLNTGRHENASQFCEPPSLQVTNLSFWYNDTENVIRNMWSDVPEDDWMMWLDSDERPSQAFLTGLESIAHESHRDGINQLRFPSVLHSISSPPSHSEASYDSLVLANANNSPYTPLRVTRVNRDKMYLNSAMGVHTTLIRKDTRDRIYPYIIHHLKNYHPELGGVLYGFAHPQCNFDRSMFGEILASWEYEAFEALKHKYTCFDSTSFLQLLDDDEQGTQQFRELFLSYRDSKYECFRYMYLIASKWNMKFVTNPIPAYCGGVCCRYNNGIQL